MKQIDDWNKEKDEAIQAQRTELGKCKGYVGECPHCHRMRLEGYDNGYEICEKCGWCPQINNFYRWE